MKFAYIWMGLVLSFLLFSRLWQFSVLPAALTHDEIVYAVQAKSFAIQGTTTNQKYFPWSLQPAHPMYAELPALLMAPFYLLFSNPIVATRSVSLLFGIGFPFVLAWFSYGLWKNQQLTLIVLSLAAINPLLWQMSRLTYDAVFSAFFYVLGGAILLTASYRKKLLSLIPLILGFFCYQGYKLLFLPWIVFLLLVYFRRKQSSLGKRSVWIVGIIALAIFVGYLTILLPGQNVENRWKQTIFADTNYQASMTNDDRRLSLSNPITPLVSNKFTAIANYLIKRYVEAFSIQMLFLNGEPAQSAFSVWGHGWFYLADLVFIIFGLVHLLSSKSDQKASYFLVGFILFSVVPSTVNSGEPWYLLRTFLPNVLLLLIAAVGIYHFWNKWFFQFAIIAIYVFSTAYFGYYYFYRYPLLGNNISYLAEKTATNYITRVMAQNPDRAVSFYTIDPPVMFWNYLVYANQLTRDNAAAIAQAENSGVYQLGKLRFTNTCPDITKTNEIIITEQWRPPCEQSQSSLAAAQTHDYSILIDKQRGAAITIPSIVDNGAYFRIYNDSICDRQAMSNFIDINSLSDFDIYKQANSEFCTKWLSAVSLKN